MRVDLLIPTLRRPLLLKSTLESIARAERPSTLEVRVVVVNNDVSPQLPEIGAALRMLPYESRIVHEPRPGKSAALNTAVSISEADYIAVVDDDEELDTRWFRVVEDALEAGGLDFVGGRSLPAERGGLPDWIPHDYPAVLGVTDMGEQSRDYTPDAPGMLSGGNAVISRATLVRVGLFCQALGPRAHRRLLSCEDEDLYGRLMDAGARGRYLHDMVVYHRIHAERLRKRYFRAWAFWNGASKGILSHRRPPRVATLAGVPRYLYGEAARGLLRLTRGSFRGDPANDRFSAELSIWHLAGHLYGRHLPDLAVGTRPAALSSQARKVTVPAQ